MRHGTWDLTHALIKAGNLQADLLMRTVWMEINTWMHINIHTELLPGSH